MILEEMAKGTPGLDTLARNLRAARAFRGLDQRELAAKSGVDRATISLLENGHRPPRRGTVRKLAKALEIPEETLRG